MKTYKIMMRRKNLKTGKITLVKEYDRGWRTAWIYNVEECEN